MVQFGGLVKDEEDDEIERVAIRKDVSKGGGGKKTLVRFCGCFFLTEI